MLTHVIRFVGNALAPSVLLVSKNVTCLHEQFTYFFVESCDARFLLGTVTPLFIPASEHSVHGQTWG